MIVYIRSSSAELGSATSSSSVESQIIQLLSTITLALIESLGVSAIRVLVLPHECLSSSAASITVFLTTSINLVIFHLDIGLLGSLLLVDALSRTVYTGLVATILVGVSASTTSARQGSSIVDLAKPFVSLDEIIQAILHFCVSVAHLKSIT